MNVKAFQNLLILIFQNCSNFCGCLNPLFNYKIKKELFKALIKIKNIKNIKKYVGFVLLNQTTPSVYFHETFSSITC
jgi:hypothetical protein